MSFGAPVWLNLLPLVLLGLWALHQFAARRARRDWAAHFSSPLLPVLLRSVSHARRLAKRILVVAGVLALGLALARPQWGRRDIVIERTGIDLMIALDLSRSMLAADSGGTNRLTVAREAVERLLGELGGDRVGLVVFAGEAMAAAPLTRDHAALQRALAAARPGAVSAAGSDLDQAIRQTLRGFDRMPPAPRTLLVVSDGEQLQGNAVEAARAARQAGLRVHTAGVGSASGAKVPAQNWGTGGFVRNPLGRDVVSRRDEPQLQRIAAAGGGVYTRLEPGDRDALVAWFRQTTTNLPRSTEKRTIDEPRERFQWPLAGALALLSFEWILRDRRRHTRLRSTASLLALGLLFQVLPGARAAGPTSPPSPWDAYNGGVQAYQAGRHADAFDRWQDLSLQRLPRGLQDPVWFQLGNAQFRLGEPLETSAPEQAADWWRRSLEAYRTVLQRSPRHTAARHNLDLVQQRLAQLLQRLGREALEAAAHQPIDRAIDLLRLSVTHLTEARSLAPADTNIRHDLDRAERALQERLLDRAARSENQGDQEAARQTAWNDDEAESQYRNALDDLGEAGRAQSSPAEPPTSPPQESSSSSAATHPSVAGAEARVRQKLADLLTRMGQREQKTGRENAQWDTSSAIEPYEAARELFVEAQEVVPRHEAAERGEREVRMALEQLLVRLGQKALEEGRELLSGQSRDAVPPLRAALGHFEEAQGLNPENPEAQAGAQEARRLLPGALARAGQQQMAAGERSEVRRPSEALSHYQEAATSFQQALDLEPDQASARQGQQEVEPRIARLRDRVAREAEQASRQNSPPGQPPASLQELLGQVSERRHEREGEWDRRRHRGQKNTGTRPNGLDW